MFINLAFLLTYFYAFFNFPGYGRALDMVALAIIPLFTFTKYVNPSNKAIISYNEFFLWLLIISLSVQSLFTTDTRAIISVISILGGLVTYMCLRKIKYIPDLKFIKNIGYLIVTVEFLELFLYYGFDYNLDLVKYFGGISNRGLNLDINMFRPSSIYQEPNQLSVSLIFILTSVIFLPPKDLLVKKFKSNDGVLNKVSEYKVKDIYKFISSNINNNISYILLLSFAIFMTTSLWGIIYALFIFLFILILSITNRKTFTSFKKDLLKFIILFGTSIFTWNYLFSNKIFRSTYFVIWIKRFNNLDNDSSAIARYSFNDFFNKIDTFSFKQMLFGHGATTSLGTFQDLLGANGFSFLLYSVGFLGIIILFAILFCALNKYKNKTFQNLFKIYFLNLSFIIFISSSYPMFTYTLFWAWLATMINSSQFYLSKSK